MKKALYILLTTILGIILSYLVHAIIEINYINYAEEITWTSHFGKGSCALPFWLQYGLFIMGGLLGFFLGFFWWQRVYVEKKH